MTDIAHDLFTTYTKRGQGRYGISAVSQMQHALQAATLAEREGGAAGFIVAALLHDVGHLVYALPDAAASGINNTHENLGSDWLGKHFGPEVVEPVRLHVAAKRYLCAVEPDYNGVLAPDSVRSLKLQGGPMTPSEVKSFEETPFWEDAVRLRRLDDRAKDPAAEVPSIEYFERYISAVLTRR